VRFPFGAGHDVGAQLYSTAASPQHATVPQIPTMPRNALRQAILWDASPAKCRTWEQACPGSRRPLQARASVKRGRLAFLLFCTCFFPITRLVKGVWLMSARDHNWVRGWFIFDPLCLVFLVIMALYFVLLEGLAGATLGKWLLGLRVVQVGGAAGQACGKAWCGTPCAWWTAYPHSTSWG
jgi:hypothetical protein